MDDQIKEEWQEVVNYIKRSKGATFAELEMRFGWLGGGDRVLEIPDLNLLLWAGVSDEGIEFYRDRRVRDQVEAKSCDWLCYAYDGRVLDMPIAKRVPQGGYKKQRWAPTALQEKRRWAPAQPVYPEGE